MKPRWVHLSCGAAKSGGFTLFEALIALVLMGLVLGLLGTVTGQWLPRWNPGVRRLQNADLLGLALERTAADIARAELVSLDARTRRAYFDGAPSFVIFVRSALGPNTPQGLEIVRIAEEPDGDSVALVRSRAPFTLLRGRGADEAGFAFTDRVVLLRAPFRTAFSFADATRKWRDTWTNRADLPSHVQIAVRNPEQGEAPVVTTIASLHMNAPSDCVRANSARGCIEEFSRSGAVRFDTDSEETKP